MDKASLKIYRRVCLTNCYDRMCNFILLHVFPLLKSSDAEVNRCYSALKYADSDLKAEKEKLKNLKKSLCNNNIAILDAIENNQIKRHSKMYEIVEGKKVR